jgi:hypothetical protein
MGVADIIKKNLGNLTGGGALGIAAGIAGSFMSGATNSIQTNAAAAKILGKSPLELNDTSPTAHMKQNPYEYGTVYYPLDVANLGTGHYILFDIIINDKTVYQNATYQNGKINPIEKVHKIPVLQRQQGRFYEQKENHDKTTAALLRCKQQKVS